MSSATKGFVERRYEDRGLGTEYWRLKNGLAKTVKQQ